MENVIIFTYNLVGMFLIFYILYMVFIAKKKKDYSKLKKNDEIVLFVTRYNLNVKKINYKKLVRCIYGANSFIIAFTSTLILNIKSFIWSVVICFVVIFVLIYSIFELLGRYFKKMEEKNV